MMSGNTQKDKEVIRKAIEGESSAFGELYDKYQPALYRFIYLKVSHREEAEDITHHVFLSAWQHISAFKDEGLPFSSWLYQIARNKIIDHYRTKRNVYSLEDYDTDQLGEISSTSEDEVASKMDMENVRKAILELTQDQQDVVLMKFVQNLSYKEISEATGKNEGSIRVIQFRAVRNLKNIIKRYESDKIRKNS